jgi:hypothetical protein
MSHVIRLTTIFPISGPQFPDAESVWLLCSRGEPRSNNWDHLELIDLLQSALGPDFTMLSMDLRSLERDSVLP